MPQGFSGGPHAFVNGINMKRILKSIWAGWKKFAHVLGVFNTKVILTILYFLVMGIAAILARTFRGDLLDRKFPGNDSLWQPREASVTGLEEAKRQF
ncbi:MAG: SxtJ family membrane protein [Candidatus Krumholzibacteriia bacterium]